MCRVASIIAVLAAGCGDWNGDDDVSERRPRRDASVDASAQVDAAVIADAASPDGALPDAAPPPPDAAPPPPDAAPPPPDAAPPPPDAAPPPADAAAPPPDAAPPAQGNQIVFVTARDGNNEIYSVGADGTGIKRLTNNAASDRQPTWSPDGTRIAFVSERSGAPEIYVMNADGSNVVRRTFAGTYCENPSWSPDGTKIAYSTLTNGSMNIWVVGPSSGSPTLLFAAPGWDNQPAWSPDGSKLALVSDWSAYDFVYDVYLINADGSGFTALTGDIFDHVDYLQPSWSPDGAKIATAITQTTGVDQYITKLGVMNANGSGLTALISAATWTKSSWSPDGSKIAFTSVSGSTKNVSWVAANGTASGVIVTNGWDPNWRR